MDINFVMSRLLIERRFDLPIEYPTGSLGLSPTASKAIKVTSMPAMFSLQSIYPDMTSIHNVVEYVDLETESGEYLEVRRQLSSLLKIVKIQRIVNPFSKLSFELRRCYHYNNIEPRTYFHGTWNENVQSICKNNFNWRLYGTSRGHLGGKGANFTNISTFTTNFCAKIPEKVMILAKVLVKNSCVGVPCMSVPPDGYDTTTRHGKTYVKYNDSEFLPEYVIYFRI